MKVGISYAVELEEIPEEVEDLLRDVQWDLFGKIEEIIEQLRSGDFPKLDTQMKNLRTNVARLDTRLEDCYTILVGYVNVLNQLAERRAAEEAAGATVDQIGPGHPITSAPTDEYDLND
tara:strand:- start:77 stop:433 length:357 start_codon:yes stop_codon:yes gene_type:complete